MSLQTQDLTGEMSRQDVEAHIIAKALKDERFKQKLLRDPIATLSEELSALLGQEIRFPEGIEVKVLEETPRTLYLVLPSRPIDEDLLLSDEELDANNYVLGWGNTGSSLCSDCCRSKTPCDTVDTPACK